MPDISFARKGRPLTEGEIEMLKEIFGDSIKYGSVKIRKRRILTRLAPAVVIDASIFLRKKFYEHDFSLDKKK